MNYNLCYSKKRKTVAISVRDGEVIVRAPHGTSREYIDSLVSKHENWICRHLEKQEKRAERFDSLTEDEVKKLKAEAKEYFKAQTEKYSKIMNIKYGRILITSAKRRFGSCSSSGNISYSFRLMLYPEAAREYVVVHELSHIREMNHSKRFYDIVEAVLPDYKERRQMLK